MLIAVYLSCLFYACLNILTHCLERSKLNIIKSLRTLAMEDLLRLATMQARAATDDTEHSTMHISAGAPDKPMNDASQDQSTSCKSDGYDDDFDHNNGTSRGNKCDCLIGPSGVVEVTGAEAHTERPFLSSTVPDTNNTKSHTDPVLMAMFRQLDDHVRTKNFQSKLVARYIKLTLAKLAVIRNVKETEIEFPDLMLAMQTLEVDTENTTIAEGDEHAQTVIKAGCALRSSYSNVCKDATRKLKQLIRDTNIHVPKVYQQNKEDDLCGVWYAIASDKYYQTHETLVPCHSYEFRALVVTYLHLVGGTPSHYTTLKKPKHTPYQQFLDLLPDFLSFSRCEQTARLGYSTRSPTTSPWKYQLASSLSALDPKNWETLSEASYEIIKSVSKQVVFLIHAADQAIPLGIATKAQNRPREWNTGAGSVTRTTTRKGSVNFPPPNFLPSTLSDSMTALMGPTPQPAPAATAGPPAQLSLPSHPASKRSRSGDGQQGSKRARV
ncbi:hypothetical protein KCU86_g6255, partial [Aureobasidium melanogenum]